MLKNMKLFVFFTGVEYLFLLALPAIEVVQVGPATIHDGSLHWKSVSLNGIEVTLQKLSSHDFSLSLDGALSEAVLGL